MIATQSGVAHLGALPPMLHIKSLNCGLSKGHLNTEHFSAYKFFRAMVHDLREMFVQQGAQGCFFCELGSQNSEESIDIFLEARCNAHKAGIFQTPAAHQEWALCDHSASLQEFLQNVLEAAGLDLQVHSAPPYAYIGDPEQLSVSPPQRFSTLPDNPERVGVRYNVEHLTTGDKFTVICNHSP